MYNGRAGKIPGHRIAHRCDANFYKYLFFSFSRVLPPFLIVVSVRNPILIRDHKSDIAYSITATHSPPNANVPRSRYPSGTSTTAARDGHDRRNRKIFHGCASFDALNASHFPALYPRSYSSFEISRTRSASLSDDSREVRRRLFFDVLP